MTSPRARSGNTPLKATVTRGMPRAAAIGAAASSADSRTTTSGRKPSMIGVRSRCIAGPAALAKFAAKSGPRRSRHRELHDPGQRRRDRVATGRGRQPGGRPVEPHRPDRIATVGCDRPPHIVAPIPQDPGHRGQRVDVPGAARARAQHPQRTLHQRQRARSAVSAHHRRAARRHVEMDATSSPSSFDLVQPGARGAPRGSALIEVGQHEVAVVVEGEAGVVGDLPGVAVGVGEVPGVSAVEGLVSRCGDRRSRPFGEPEDSSTSSGVRTFCASAMPPNPSLPASAMPTSSARLLRPQSTTAEPPAWTNTVDSTSWPRHPRLRRRRGTRDVGDAEGDQTDALDPSGRW